MITIIQSIGVFICLLMVAAFVFFILGTVAMNREVSEDELAGALEGDLTEVVKKMNEERA